MFNSLYKQTEQSDEPLTTYYMTTLVLSKKLLNFTRKVLDSSRQKKLKVFL